MIRLEPEFHIEDSHIGGRSPATCRWKCGDACAQPILNPSQNTYMRDVVEEALTRRSFLAASMAGLFVMSGVANISKAQAAGTLGFKPIGLSSEDRILLADGYTHNVVIRWGDPSGGPLGASTFTTGTPRPRKRPSATTATT
jgi:hypothetical protein